MKIDNSINLLGLNQVRIPANNKDDAELKKATDKFEAIFVKQFLDLTLKPKYGTMPKGTGSDIHTSMYTRAVSESLSGVFGISDMLFKHLKDNK